MNSEFKDLRVLLVHDWLTGYRGGEKVLEQLVTIFPGADLYTFIHVPGVSGPVLSGSIASSWLSWLPGVRRYYRGLLPVYPLLASVKRFTNYDVVISSSHSYAKGVRVAEGTRHLCYCHTPIRYAWAHRDAYLGRGVLRTAARPAVDLLRAWDRRTSTPQRITSIVCNSHYIRERIRRAWGRDASVVYPGVDISHFPLGIGPRASFFLLVGGFVPYKAEHLAIEAFRRLPYTLLVAGDGPRRKRLAKKAPANVTFLRRVSDERLVELYRTCRALIYPQEEDFGLVAVEAQACGAPVIALGRGGATETVIPLDDTRASPTGLFFHESKPDALMDAVQQFEQHSRRFDASQIRSHAARFSVEAFREGILSELRKCLSVPPGRTDALS